VAGLKCDVYLRRFNEDNCVVVDGDCAGAGGAAGAGAGGTVRVELVRALAQEAHGANVSVATRVSVLERVWSQKSVTRVRSASTTPVWNRCRAACFRSSTLSLFIHCLGLTWYVIRGNGPRTSRGSFYWAAPTLDLRPVLRASTMWMCVCLTVTVCHVCVCVCVDCLFLRCVC